MQTEYKTKQQIVEQGDYYSRDVFENDRYKNTVEFEMAHGVILGFENYDNGCGHDDKETGITMKLAIFEKDEQGKSFKHNIEINYQGSDLILDFAKE